MLHQSNNELGLLNFGLIVFKLKSSMLGGMVINIQSSKIGNLLHSQSSMGPIVSMEMPQAEAYLKILHIIEWVKSINFSKNPPSMVMLIWPRLHFNFENYSINKLN